MFIQLSISVLAIASAILPGISTDCTGPSCHVPANLRQSKNLPPPRRSSLNSLNATGPDGDVKTLNWRIIEHRDGKLVLKSYLIYDPSVASQVTPAPAVLVLHDWDGRDEFENRKAETLAVLGYVAYAVDLFGGVGGSPWRNDHLIDPFRKNRALLLHRLQLAKDEVLKLPFVDTDRVAAIGFSFGALGALDMARAGWDLRGVVSVHGTLGAPKVPWTSAPGAPSIQYTGNENVNITAKILVLHGFLDIRNRPDSVRAFQHEMSRRRADWQVHLYSSATGDFSNPKANVPGRSMYDSVADERSWTAVTDFLEEIFQ